MAFRYPRNTGLIGGSGGGGGGSDIDYIDSPGTYATPPPHNPSTNEVRYNPVNNVMEFWNGSIWQTVEASIDNDFIREIIVPSDGQTVFNLTNEPNDPDQVEFYIRGTQYFLGIHFTLTGPTNQVLTWTADITEFEISSTDEIVIRYWKK